MINKADYPGNLQPAFENQLNQLKMIRIRRVYDPVSPGENYKVLVDRFWPRGISKEEARWDEWIREISPSNDLRKWFNHDPGKWEEFRKIYKEELADKSGLLKKLKDLELKHGTLTLLYSASDTEYNNAVALREFLMKM
jgi:uncharacterized protein YeaO (DUF488 family)